MVLWKRFGNNKADKEVFHSSGIVASPDADTLGSTSSETFEQRRKVERSRQVIGGYHDAGIIHNYKREAQGHRMGQRSGAHHVKHVSTGGATQSNQRRIDIINPRHSATNDTAKNTTHQARQRAPISDVRRPSHSGVQPVVKPSFHEPGGRRYNPYQ